MANHVKPSKEELEANAARALEEAERLQKEEEGGTTNPTPSDPIPSDPIPSTSQPIPSGDGEGNEPSKPAPSAGIPGSTDWKKRYTDSSREAKVLSIKNKEINSAVDEAAQLTPPTDDEMKQEFPEWDEMTSIEQRLAKSDLLNKRKFDLIHEATQKYKKLEDWQEKVDAYVDDPKVLNANPELEGKQEEFRLFATKPTRAGMDFDDLVLAFLGEETKSKKPSNKGNAMFPTGNGGSKNNNPPQPQDDKLTAEQGRQLMKTDYKKFKEYLRAGKIKNE